MKKLSIVIPVFNEEKFIYQILIEVSKSDSLDFTKEIIVVDDGSKDKTKAEIKRFEEDIKRKDKNLSVKCIFKPKNEGKGSALKEGFLASSGDIVLIQDGDLEYDPNDYPTLLEPFIKYNADVVYGSRFISNRPHRVLYFWHYQVNLFLTTFSNMLTNLNLTDMESGYKAFKGELLRKIAVNLESRGFGFEPEITARISKVKGLKFFEVGISYSGRTYEEGKKIGWKDGVKAIWEIFKFNILNS